MKKKYLSFGLAAMLALAGCGGSQDSGGTSLYKAGTYTATGTGKNGDVQVTVEFTDDAIKSVTIGENSETEAIAKPAFDTIPQEIVDAQSTQVDVVSGATLTSNAIIEAVNDCIVQAGGTVPSAAAETAAAAKEEKSEA
ncbi:FMN-binding protein, partial [Galactobacillus timonensis]